jgi:two-component sensor histidine kinase/predicted hydrocarbon binding protein
MAKPENTDELLAELERLKKENAALRYQLEYGSPKKTVIVPVEFAPIFDVAEKNVSSYFSEITSDAEQGEIEIRGERYILFRAAAISYEFLDVFKELYSNKPEEEAVSIGNNFLFDIAHVLGKEDGKVFHKKMNLTDPIQKLAAGPVHFAYTGWANVEILPESRPSPGDDFYLKFYHHNSFEAQSWIKAKRKSELPVCTMNCGYSSGWCAESFGMDLTTVEVCCEAQGAEHCTFIMAPPHMMQKYLEKQDAGTYSGEHEIPVFFQRKYNEDKLRDSLRQKETLLREVHHRVKNNLQIISSLLNLQRSSIDDEKLRSEFMSSISRVNTMARIHEMIYGDKNVSSINIEKYFTKLLRSLFQVYNTAGNDIEVKVSIKLYDVIFFPDKAIPLGLILNEIACNSFKYAFSGKGVFYLSLTEEEKGKYLLVVGDNGKGLPEHIKEGSLGLSLIPVLCEQIDAQLEVVNSSNGLEYRITFEH